MSGETWGCLGYKYAAIFAVNLAIETIVCLLVLRKACSVKRSLLACAIGNAVTHPGIHFLLPLIVSAAEWPSFIVIAESIALIVEALVYLAIATPKPRTLALAASAGANLASFTAGLLLFPS